EPAADQDRVLVALEDTATAPLDADGEEIVAVEDLHPRLDLHLWERDVELLADQRLDPLQVSLVVPDEDRVRGLVGADRDARGAGRGPEARRAPPPRPASCRSPPAP